MTTGGRIAVLACAVTGLLSCWTAGASATTGKEVGGMNLSAYCQQLEAGNKGATLSGETWVCIHADNTESPLNLQAACEHEYTQRPIKAEEITPGVPFSWKCFQISESETEGAKGGGEGSGGGPRSATSTIVSCNLDFATLQETCTATVAGGKAPPTGTVTFSSSGGGVFTFGATCTLAPGGPGTPDSSCHVAFIPPSKSLTVVTTLAITAAYGGDATHTASSNGTSPLAAQQTAVETAATGSGNASAGEVLSHNGIPFTVSAEVPGTIEITVAFEGSGGTLPILHERTGTETVPPILNTHRHGGDRIHRNPRLRGRGSTLPVLRKPEENGGGSTLPITLLPPRPPTGAWAAAHRVKLLRVAHVRVKVTHPGRYKLRATLNREGRRLTKRIIAVDRAYRHKHKGKAKGTPPGQPFIAGILYTPGR